MNSIRGTYVRSVCLRASGTIVAVLGNVLPICGILAIVGCSGLRAAPSDPIVSSSAAVFTASLYQPVDGRPTQHSDLYNSATRCGGCASRVSRDR